MDPYKNEFTEMPDSLDERKLHKAVKEKWPVFTIGELIELRDYIWGVVGTKRSKLILKGVGPTKALQDRMKAEAHNG